MDLEEDRSQEPAAGRAAAVVEADAWVVPLPGGREEKTAVLPGNDNGDGDDLDEDEYDPFAEDNHEVRQLWQHALI